MKNKDTIETFSLKDLKSPDMIKSLNYKQLSSLCFSIREEIIQACSLYGGHLSSNLGDVELTVALYRIFDFPKDKLIFDVGHQCYTHKLLSGRSLEHLNSPGYSSGFQKIKESIFDPYEAGHSSTSISAAEGFAIARDFKNENYNVIALIGDASIVNGLAFEGLNDLSARSHKVIIILNDNDRSISMPVGGTSKFFRKISSGKVYNSFKKGYRKVLYRTELGKKIYSFSCAMKNAMKRRLVPVTLFDNLGYTYIGPIDGHDIKELEKALKRSLACTKSVVLHIRTIKGKGYKLAENDENGYWHGVTPFNIETGEPKNIHPGYISWSHYFSDLTYEAMKENKNNFLIVPATLKGSGLEKTFKDFPSRCLDVGIAEEHALTLAGALSLNGFHPIVTIYSTFLQRAYDEISHDCARLKVPVTILIDRAGLVGKNGDTHQGIYDEAYLSSIPNVILSQPSTKPIAKALYKQSLEHNHGVFCIRYSRELIEEKEEKEETLDFLSYKYLNNNSKNNIVLGIGQKGRELLDLLAKNNIDISFCDPIYLNPIPEKEIEKLINYKNIFIYDAYGIENGFASNVSLSLLKKRFKGNLFVRAVPNSFVDSDSYSNQLSNFGLLPEQVLSFIEETLSRKD